ncbi:MAG: polyprenyl synthetase family protein [Candidatus Bathyarchaeota archaeon]|nr:polyprenyl synthetase family protein [Candidatus Bathyarchaeota archaeon]
MSPRKHKKTSEMLLETLKERSKKGLEFARRTILAENIECEEIHEALEYYTSNWKNFTHPGLFSIACEAVGGNPDEAVRVQAAIAMITAALDVHDDIIDKSDMKYGRPTVFGKFGQNMALLLGNAFFVSGFTLLSKSTTRLHKEKMREILETLKRSLFEIGSAHALELNLRGKMDTAPEDYMQILKMKAASVEANMRIGAIVGGGTNNEIEVLTKYGRILGILATLREDFIDVFEIQELRQRIQNECLPIPILYALQNEKSRRIQKILLKKRMTDEDADKLLDIVFETKEVKKLKRKMKILIRNALRLISKIENQHIKLSLSRFVTAALEDL